MIPEIENFEFVTVQKIKAESNLFQGLVIILLLRLGDREIRINPEE